MQQGDEDEWELPDPGELSAPDEAGGGGPPADAATGAAARVLEEKRDELMQRPGVTMVGETLDVAGRSAIMIGVKTASDLRALPSEVGGVPVVGTVTGEVDALHTGPSKD